MLVEHTGFRNWRDQKFPFEKLARWSSIEYRRNSTVVILVYCWHSIYISIHVVYSTTVDVLLLFSFLLIIQNSDQQKVFTDHLLKWAGYHVVINAGNIYPEYRMFLHMETTVISFLAVVFNTTNETETPVNINQHQLSITRIPTTVTSISKNIIPIANQMQELHHYCRKQIIN